ncbi:photoreceptor cilium actin regulator [Gastrophryne carolinensis]
MGCTPSHSGIVQILAKNTANPLRKNKAILGQDKSGITHPPADNLNPNPNDEINPPDQKFSSDSHGMSRTGSLSEDQRKNETHGTADEGMVHVTCQKKRTTRKYSSTGSEQELQQDTQQDGKPRRGRKSKGRKCVKHSRRTKQAQIVCSETEKKVDFPEVLVKAHQDAYAFMNPNLSKYEAIISMANQTTQTQIIMQQMITFMALRFDEINECLGDISVDGEKLLKEVGSNLTWPRGKDSVPEQPDLLQQLLLYTVNKMQSLNCTVSSLTTNALQEICRFLQSAEKSFQEKLKKKEHHDKCLQKMIKEFEDLATGCTQSQPNDSTLFSEDSGIGGDGESMRGYGSSLKIERQTSIDTLGHVSLTKTEGMTSQQESRRSNLTNSNDLKTKLDNSDNNATQVQMNNPEISKKISFSSSHSLSSLGTTATLTEDSVQDQDPDDSTSSDESSEESDDNNSISSQITLPQRPLTSPAGTCAYRPTPKWIENPENEAMTLKMKEAISEKIKFVPENSNTDIWTREDLEPETLRPSTADGGNRRTARHRRCRSAESLKSHSDDPTLLELQRTQKELSKKLEQLYSHNGPKNEEGQKSRTNKSYAHTECISSRAALNNKLKACLDRNFNILPSQERITLRKSNDDIEKDSITAQERETVVRTLPKQNEMNEESAAVSEPKLEGITSPRKSVRKLIQAFSPEDDLVKISRAKTLGPLRCVRKFGVPVLPPTIPTSKGLPPLDTKDDNSSSADKHQNSSTNIYPSASQESTRSDKSEFEFEDLENLPPPPPEILLDDSFNLLQSNIPAKENTLLCPVKSISTSSKIKSSINIKDLLPNKNTSETYMPSVKTSGVKEQLDGLRKYSLQQNRNKDLGLNTQKKDEIEKVAHLYKQSHKIIPLQNPSDSESVKSVSQVGSGEQCSPTSLGKPKQCSPSPTLQRCAKSPVAVRRTSPTRAMASSPPTERKIASPPTNRARTESQGQPKPIPPPPQKVGSPTCFSRVPSPPNQCKPSSPSTQRKLPSPPQIRRQQSPPGQRRLPSPPQTRKLQSPPNQSRVPSPPSSRREPSPPSHFTPSPPLSPSISHRRLRSNSDDSQTSPKIIGNAQSIFCPSSTSLFETKPASPPHLSSSETASRQASVSVLKHSLSMRQYDDQHRRVAMSAANPQPFVRRSYSDRRPRVQLRLPTSVSMSACQQTGPDGSPRQDSQSGSNACLEDLKDPTQSQLCVVGQGFQ